MSSTNTGTSQIEFLNYLAIDAYPAIGYWARVTRASEPKSLDDVVFVLTERESDDGTVYTLTAADIAKGLDKLIDAADETYANFSYSSNRQRLTELRDSNGDLADYDATDADAVIQMAALGEVIYG